MAKRRRRKSSNSPSRSTRIKSRIKRISKSSGNKIQNISGRIKSASRSPVSSKGRVSRSAPKTINSRDKKNTEDIDELDEKTDKRLDVVEKDIVIIQTKIKQ